MGVLNRVVAAIAGREADEAPDARRTSAKPCPACGETKRVESNAFGSTYDLLCARCAHNFGEVTR